MSWLPCPHCDERIAGLRRGRRPGRGRRAHPHPRRPVPLLGQVPIDLRLREGGDEGKPPSLTDPDAPAARGAEAGSPPVSSKKPGRPQGPPARHEPGAALSGPPGPGRPTAARSAIPAGSPRSHHGIPGRAGTGVRCSCWRVPRLIASRSYSATRSRRPQGLCMAGIPRRLHGSSDRRPSWGYGPSARSHGATPSRRSQGRMDRRDRPALRPHGRRDRVRSQSRTERLGGPRRSTEPLDHAGLGMMFGRTTSAHMDAGTAPGPLRAYGTSRWAHSGGSSARARPVRVASGSYGGIPRPPRARASRAADSARRSRWPGWRFRFPSFQVVEQVLADAVSADAAPPGRSRRTPAEVRAQIGLGVVRQPPQLPERAGGLLCRLGELLRSWNTSKAITTSIRISGPAQSEHGELLLRQRLASAANATRRGPPDAAGAPPGGGPPERGRSPVTPPTRAQRDWVGVALGDGLGDGRTAGVV